MKKYFVFILLSLSVTLSAQTPMQWRGIMIDVSRHFMPVEYLYKEVDALSYFGMNRLHLHLTDAAGWRLEIKSRPRLTDVGAWRTHQRWTDWWKGERKYSDSINGFGGFYTQQQMRDLVAYAEKKGVMIIPEIEFPAHSEEAVAAYPEIGFNHAEMDMKKEETYQFMRDVLTEVADIFPSPYLHVGGDEAATQNDIQPEGMRRVKEIVSSLGRRVIVWDEALTDNPDDYDMIIMVWRNIETARRALELGHDVILSPGKYCYLDKAQDAPVREPFAAGGYLPVDSVYMIPNPAKDYSGKGCLLGMQCNLWTEHVETPDYAEYMIWPRAYAVAELGKTGLTDDRDVKTFHKRAVQASKILRKRFKINAFDLKKEFGERNVKMKSRYPVNKVIYNTNPGGSYQGSGERTLCDGRCGGWNNTDGRWQGFIGRGMDVILDMGNDVKISSVIGDFMQSTGPEIFFPYSIEITVSSDLQNWKPVCNATYDELYAVRQEDYQQMGWGDKIKKQPRKSNETVSARYVRMRAMPGPKSGWIFCSEVSVQ